MNNDEKTDAKSIDFASVPLKNGVILLPLAQGTVELLQ